MRRVLFFLGLLLLGFGILALISPWIKKHYYKNLAIRAQEMGSIMSAYSRKLNDEYQNLMHNAQ